MTQLEPYQPPQDAVGFPLRLDVNGQTYVLVQGDHNQTIQPHHQPPIQYGPRLNGVQQIWTPQGYRPAQDIMPYQSDRPYHAHPGHPPWLRNHYTRGTGMIVGGAAIGVVLLCAGIAFFAVVTWVMAHAIQIGMALLSGFVGLMILLAGITKMRHGHPMRR